MFFWLSACSILIVVSLLYVRPSFPLVDWTEGVRYLYRFLIIAFFLLTELFNSYFVNIASNLKEQIISSDF